MSREKQIDEMAKLICTYPQCIHHNIIGECANAECQTVDIAENLYKQGYRKQSENVIELPCKVGTTLYFIYNSPYADKPDLTPRIYKTADWYFEVDKTGIVINTSYIHSFNKEYDYHLGKTVFFTQEEAEKALAKMKGGAE